VTAEDTAAAVKDAVATLGGAYMMGDEVRAAGKRLGTGGWGTYFIGRCGVLGDVDAAVVESVVGFFPEERVRAGWERGRSKLTPAEGAAAYAEVCAEWGRARLSELEHLDELVELLDVVVDCLPCEGAPLAAGWRAMPRVDDAAGRVPQLVHIIREHRGAMHLAAVLATGLTPAQAVVLTGGEGNASFFGYEEPYVDVSRVEKLREPAEQLTNRMAGVAWHALDSGRAARAVRLLTAARELALAS
jgi:hypothetical protein